MQFWPPDDEHMCSKHVEAWNKLIVKQKFCALSWLITETNIWAEVYYQLIQNSPPGSHHAEAYYQRTKDSASRIRHEKTITSSLIYQYHGLIM